MAIEVARYNAATGTEIEVITAPLQSLQAEYRLYGGCSIARLSFVEKWTQPVNWVAEKGDELFITNDSVPVFSGRVVSVQPYLNDSQLIQVSGWKNRLNELEVVAPLLDKVTFGNSGDPDAPTDHPEITTAFELVEWLVATIIAPDSQSPITSGVVSAPAVPCKFGGVFAIYAGDELGDVIETLATMEDCVWGVAADRSFYYLPRSTALATTAFTAKIDTTISAGWRTDGTGIVMDGSFIQERRGPNVVAVQGRDINGGEGTRTYALVGALDGTRRQLTFYEPNIRSGPGSRRFARGIFRRFSNFAALKVIDLDCITGPRRFEPHLGAVEISNLGTVVATDLAGSMDVTFLPSLSFRVDLGENTADAGSGNPAKDPFTSESTVPDIPQVDTGDGLTDPDYTIPSGDIDFDDGWDGDGDDFHINDDRELPEDLPGSGVGGVDYGSDTANPGNGRNTPTATESFIWFGRILGPGVTAGKFNLRLFFPGGGTAGDYSDCAVWPPVASFVLQANQPVLAFFPRNSARSGYATQPVIDGNSLGRDWPAKITSLATLPTYEVTLYSSNLTTVVAVFTECKAWPTPTVPLELNQELWATFPNGATTPVVKTPPQVIRTYGIGNGEQCHGWQPRVG